MIDSKHWKYAGYIFWHKFYVGQECFKRGLYYRGIIHDYDKLFPGRWLAYARFFNTKEVTPDIKEAFRDAWRRHWQNNDHHWQWWISIHDDGKVRPHEMSNKAKLEMLADWIGAHKALGGKDLLGWYEQREETIIMAPKTKMWLRQELMKLRMEETDG